MTTASRVSDSRGTDEMVREWAERHDIFNSGSGGHLTDARAAFDDAKSLSALSHQGELVKVSELRALVGAWQRKADGLGFPYGEDYLGCGRDLNALIAKANGHE